MPIFKHEDIKGTCKTVCSPDDFTANYIRIENKILKSDCAEECCVERNTLWQYIVNGSINFFGTYLNKDGTIHDPFK
jgi:hypothetical protein